MTMILKPNGEVEWIEGEPFIPVINVKRRRLSHVTPAFAPIRLPLFKLLRRVFGDRGRVAAWTRTWRGPWKVKIVATGEWSLFEKRSDAIAWEMEQVQGAKFEL